MKGGSIGVIMAPGRGGAIGAVADRTGFFNVLLHRRGLTLVEVLAVVIILGLIAGTLVIGFSGSFGRARQELARSGIGTIVSKLELYRMEHGRWPGNEVGLAALSDGYATPGAPYYLPRDQLFDPWGNPYLYITPGPNGLPYEVISYGADGQPGGTAGTEDAEISSANLRGLDR